MIKRFLVLILTASMLLTFPACSKIEEYYSFEEQDYVQSQVMYVDTFENLFPFGRYIFHGKFVEMKRHLSKSKRAEYVFEVIEWFKGGEDETRFSLYSHAEGYGRTEKNVKKRYNSTMEFHEKFEGCDYVEGEEYVIIAYNGSNNKPLLTPEVYIPLNDLSKANKGKMSVFYKTNELLFPEMTSEEFLDFIRTRVEEAKAEEEEAKAEAE